MIRSIMIVEIAGRPAGHIKETLEKHVGVLKSFKDIRVNSISISEPKEIEGSKDVFTCFAEVDFENESFGRLCDTVFDFMPSSIEIIEPSKINFTNLEASTLLNLISGRMHKYDEAARIMNFKMNQMAQIIKKTQDDKVVKNVATEKSGTEEIKETKKKKKLP